MTASQTPLEAVTPTNSTSDRRLSHERRRGDLSRNHAIPLESALNRTNQETMAGRDRDLPRSGGVSCPIVSAELPSTRRSELQHFWYVVVFQSPAF